MANIRISQLPSPQFALTGAEIFPIVQNGQTVQTSLATVANVVSVVSLSFGTTGLTPSSSTSGAIVVGGVLGVNNGGTGQTTYTNGQLLIGNSTGNTLTKATLTAGSGISITNGSGSITIAIDGSGEVVSFSTTLSGLTPSTATGGAITLAGTLGVPSGGTGLTTLSAGSIIYGAGVSAYASLAIGTAGQVLTVNSGATAPQWSTLSGVAVTTFSGGTTGFTPASATSGAITLAGTLVVGNGGTGLATLTAGYIPYGAGTSAFASVSTFNYNTTTSTLNAPIMAVSSVTSTTPVLSFNASNTSFASGATISGSYLQHLLQNKSGTAGASTNYVLSNDLGTDSTYYGEFGMNSSIFSSGTPADFFSINNGIYFSGHDGDVSVGSGNGGKHYFVWGSSGQSSHVINASGALGFSTNLGTTPALSGTTGFGTSGQVLTSAGSAAAPTWTTPNAATITLAAGSGATNYLVYAATATGNVAEYTTTGLTFNATNTAITGGINGGTF